MKHPILSVYSTSSTAPFAQWLFDDRGNLVSDRPDIAPARLIGSACCAVERVKRGPHQSLHLAGGYVTLPVTPLLDVGEEDFSICAWIRTGDFGISKIIDKRIENSGPLVGWSLFIYAGRINLQLADSSGWVNYVNRGEQTASLPVVSDNQWHHVAVAIDRDQLDGGRWYVDGTEVSWRFNPTRSKQNSLSNSIPLTIGRRSDNFGGSFRGNIGDLRLCKWALSAEEVRSIYQSVQSPPSNEIDAPDAVSKNFAFFDRGVRLPERYLYQEIESESLDIHSHNSADSACRSLGKYSRAIEYYQQSLQIQRDIGNRYGEASSLSNLGNIYGSVGEYSRAIEYYQQSLQIQRDIGNRQGEATSLNALGNIYDSLGEYLRAIECHQQSLNIQRDIGNHHGKATCWRDLGHAYHSLGEYHRAIEYHQQSLDMARKLNSGHREVNSLNALGSVYGSMREYQRVIEYCQQSLNMAREIDNRYAETAALNNLGSAYCSLGEYQQAIEYHHQSLDMARDMGDRSGEATSLRGLGNAYHCLGQYHRAIDYYQQSLGIAQSIGELAEEGISLSNLGITLFNFDKLTDAERILRNGIDVWESIRRRLGSNNDFKVSIFETQAATYRHLQKVLIVQDKPNDALEIAERGRARAFVELLASRLSANPDTIPDIDPPDIEQIQQIASVQNATLVEYSIVSNEELYIWVIRPTSKVTFRQVDLKSLTNPLFNLVLDTRQSIGVRSRGQAPALAIVPGDLVKLNDDAPDWEPWQVVAVDASCDILSLWQSSFPQGLTIPRPITDVATKVESLRTNHPHLQQLHQLLIEPIADLLPTDPEACVIFLPQGALFMVPFPALQDAQGKYLVEKHTILTAPAIQVLELTRHKRQQVQGNALDILVVGNPTMPKVSLVPGDPPQQLAPLPHSEQEAFAIAQLFQTQALIGNQATKAAIIQQLPNARIIHLATHGLLDNIRSMGSAIALAPCGTDNGLLTAEEILELNLNAELVVLSACNTGMGRLTGDGVIGLSRSLISAGTPSVIVSLWAVPDAPTATLLTEFYQNLLHSGDKAQALRQAMLKTMQQHPNPRDWAAFTLIGKAK